eukprot:352893-Chlamydomonas_euryale.AAC.9
MEDERDVDVDKAYAAQLALTGAVKARLAAIKELSLQQSEAWGTHDIGGTFKPNIPSVRGHGTPGLGREAHNTLCGVPKTTQSLRPDCVILQPPVVPYLSPLRNKRASLAVRASPTTRSADVFEYEKPTNAGDSRNSMLATRFQASGFFCSVTPSAFG